jgi:hypothetical protein
VLRVGQHRSVFGSTGVPASLLSFTTPQYTSELSSCSGLGLGFVEFGRLPSRRALFACTALHEPLVRR